MPREMLSYKHEQREAGKGHEVLTVVDVASGEWDLSHLHFLL